MSYTHTHTSTLRGTAGLSQCLVNFCASFVTPVDVYFPSLSGDLLAISWVESARDFSAHCRTLISSKWRSLTLGTTTKTLSALEP
jgi:hypothetical protein